MIEITKFNKIPKKLKKSDFDKRTLKHRPNARTRKATKAKRINNRKHKFSGVLGTSRRKR